MYENVKSEHIELIEKAITYARSHMTDHELSVQNVADAAGFFYDNPDFTPVDTAEVITYLLDTDSIRYARLCSEIQYMNIALATPDGDYTKGFIGIRGLPARDPVLEITTENMTLLAEWLKRFHGNLSFCCSHDQESVLRYLHEHDVNIHLKCRPQAVYLGSALTYTLPESIQIKKLDSSCLPHIKEWANGKSDPYIRHLMTPPSLS